jgi:MFS transporter, FHS family, Na+ dependent glucose transporter 1
MNSTATTLSAQSETRDYRKHLLGTYYAAFLVLGLIMMALGSTLTVLSKNLDASFEQLSYGFMFRSLGFFSGSILGGRIFDKLPGHRVLLAGLSGMALFSALVPIAPNLYLFLFLFLLQGLSGSLLNVGGNTMVLWSNRGRNVGPLLTGLHFSWGLGSAISPLIIEQVERLSGGIIWVYGALSLMAIPVLVMLFRLPSPSHPQVSEDEKTPPLILPLAILVGCFFFLYTGFEASVISWLNTYTTEARLGDKSAAYKISATFLFVFTFGRLLAIFFASKFRPRTILITDFIGCFVSVGAILIWSSSVSVLWVASCILGLSMASIFPTMLAFAERRMTLSGKLTGYLFSASSGGSMILPFVVGQFFTTVGPHVLYYVVFSALTIDSIIFVVLMMKYQTKATK